MKGLPRNRESFNTRVISGLALEQSGRSEKEVAHSLGYCNTGNWVAAKKRYESRMHPKKEQPIIRPLMLWGTSKQTLGSKISGLFGISESDLSDIVDLIISCHVKKQRRTNK